jgi:hypothetical protein
MSVRVMTMVWDAEFPTPVAKIIALKLADHSNDDGKNIYPSLNTMELSTGVSHTALCVWLNVFDETGLVPKTPCVGGSRAKSTIRAFNLDLLKDISATRTRGRVVIPAPRKWGEIGFGKDKRWAIVVNAPATSTASVPVPQADQSAEGTLGVPLRDSGSPPAGHKPSYNRQRTVPLPARAHRRAGEMRNFIGFAKAWTEDASRLAVELRDTMPNVGAFIAASCGTLNPPDHVDQIAYLRQLTVELGEFDEDVLLSVARQLGDRRRDLPCAGDLAGRAQREREQRTRKATEAAVRMKTVGIGNHASARLVEADDCDFRGDEPRPYKPGTPEHSAYVASKPADDPVRRRSVKLRRADIDSLGIERVQVLTNGVAP